MTTTEQRGRNGMGQWLQRILHFALLAATAATLHAQTVPVSPSATQVPATAAAPSPAAAATQPVPVQIEPAEHEKVLTATEEKAVLNDLMPVMEFVSKDSGLAVKRPVGGRFLSREQVGAELRKRFDEDKDTQRMQRSELVLKKFGLLDRDFHLRPFLLSLLTEQIAGYYDDTLHTMTLLNWVPLKQQESVMAHELTHALQDQRVGLKTWGDQEVPGIARTEAEDNAHIARDEADTTREAVTEGQAMITFADYELKGSGKTVKDVPELAERLEQGAGDVGSSPVLQRAPLVLEQALLFPYVEGLAFEAAVLEKQGTWAAFAHMLDAPPNSSFEIMNPDAFMEHAAVPVLRMPDVNTLIDAAGWRPYDVGVMGELDVRMLIELFGGKPMSRALAPSWAGGIYLAAVRKEPGAAAGTTKSLGLMYASRWKSEASARDFFAVFDGEMPRQYDHLERVKSEESGLNERVYHTEEGDVLIAQSGNGVWVSEGFDLPTARRMRALVNAAQVTGALQQARVGRKDKPSGPELMRGVVNGLGAFGLVKAALVR